MNLLVTGGAGFIGTHFIRYWLKGHPRDKITNLDKLTYAGNLDNLKDLNGDPRHRFVRGDVGNPAHVTRALKGVDAVVHFAAETHVDRSLLDAAAFLKTNIQGTYTLANAARLAGVKKFIHVSTDEVYGSHPKGTTPETHLLTPSSPYAASKAASDHMVLSQWATYGFPAYVTRCTNNYGPYQYPEKFLPLFITNALENIPLPLYGRGVNVRNWIHVRDHCAALEAVLRRGRPGHIYNIAADQEWKNIDVARLILKIIGRPQTLIRSVQDRPGHDIRYAPDSRKIRRELGWRPAVSFQVGLVELIQWYVTHEDWWRAIKSKKEKFPKYYTQWHRKRIRHSAGAPGKRSS